jgi:hypothetical protein
MSHNPTHAMVSHKLNLGRGSRWQSLITKRTTRAHINLVFAISLLMSALSTPTHEQLEQKKKKKKMKKRAHPNDQKPEKSQKLGHLK